MRYIGCKRRLLPFIHDAIKENNIKGKTFCDLFAGTATVGNYFKREGYHIISNDLLYCSYVQQYVKVYINRMPDFKKIAAYLRLDKSNQVHYGESIIEYLNKLNGMEGYIYNHYSPGGTAKHSVKRMYFTDENAKKIDMIREIIEAWKQLDLINEDEFYILLYALLEEVSKRANTTGMQTAFLKHFDPGSLRSFAMSLPIITNGDLSHQVYWQDSLDLVKELESIDILYLDPPYTRKQYAAAYHILETIALWDYPELKGISGIRDTRFLKSTFSSKRYAFQSLQDIVSLQNYQHLLISYSSDSIIPHEDVVKLLNQYGEVKVHAQKLARYNSMSKDDERYNAKSHVVERLYYLKPYITKFNSRPLICHSKEAVAHKQPPLFH